MSTRVQSIFDEVARQFGDPRGTRATGDALLPIYNYVIRDIGSRVNAIRYVAYFDLVPFDEYTYPDEMTQMVSLEVSTTPDDAYSYQEVDESDETRWRSLRQGGLIGSDKPAVYYPEEVVLRIWPVPEVTVVRGGRITYFGLPDEESNYATGYLPLPDFMRDWVVDGMLIRLLYANKQSQEGEEAYRLWALREGDYKDRLTSRSADARPRIQMTSVRRGMRNYA